jgi:uncharacterized protein YggU (UPF0235/DUF167 family)
LKVPLAAVRIASGERSRTKRVEIFGVLPAMIRALCDRPPCPTSKPSS